ncbi:MAG TPA: hypothetical protein VJN64_08405, partial [Terriglobales bacterium]|nr:hypothetical protein [Terriglobales bacterium]
VTWSVTGSGSISSTGVYLAPSAFPSPNTATVTATSGSQTGTASIAVVFPNDNAGVQSIPIKLGTSGGNTLDNSTDGKSCCIGTLGSLWSRGTAVNNLFILSNNHVLARSSLGKAGENIDQPGQPGCPSLQGTNVANLTEQAALKPTAGTAPGPCRGSTAPICGLAPSNVDAAIAQIVPTTVDTSGTILDLGSPGASSIAAAPPSSTLANIPTVVATDARVAKSGRTTGLTCSTVQAALVDGVVVDYDQSCGGAIAFSAVFNGQVVVNGGTFSAGGDSGSLIVTADTSEPVALLFAGNTASTVGNPVSDVIKAFTQAGPPVVAPAIVGGADHAVSCDPTAQTQSVQVGAQSVAVSARQQQLAENARAHQAIALMSSEPAIRSVKVGASSDSPGESALLIELKSLPKNRVPAIVEGVRTKVVYAQGVIAPAMSSQEFQRGAGAKSAHLNELLQPGIQGVGVGRSDDSPGESAIVIYTIKGEAHQPIPAMIDGVRTKIVEGERFRASHWNPKLEQEIGSCPKARTANKK